MKIWPDAIYVKQDVLPKNLKLTYDKTSKIRPAWIWVDGLEGQRVTFLRIRIGTRFFHYKAYMSSRLPLYLPVNNTSEEMRKFYDKFSKIYDNWVSKNNIPAIKFLLKRLRKWKLLKNIQILDLGAGTGLAAEQIIKSGFKNITLVDFSKKMQDKAKKKKLLKGCKFIRQDIHKLKLKDKFDLTVSIFSFAYSSYFKEEDMPKLWRLVAKQLKPKGILAMFGNEFEPSEKLFRKLDAGIYLLVGKYAFRYYIGVKR